MCKPASLYNPITILSIDPVEKASNSLMKFLTYPHSLSLHSLPSSPKLPTFLDDEHVFVSFLLAVHHFFILLLFLFIHTFLFCSPVLNFLSLLSLLLLLCFFCLSITLPSYVQFILFLFASLCFYSSVTIIFSSLLSSFSFPYTHLYNPHLSDNLIHSDQCLPFIFL